MSQYDELKRLAEIMVRDVNGDLSDAEARNFHQHLSDYEAATTPEKILVLIAENERLSADCSSMRGSLKANAVSIKKLIKDGGRAARERDQLRAEVAGLKTGYQAYEQVNAELKAENEALSSVIEDLDRARIAGFEEYDFTRLNDRRGDKKVFEITIETECGCDVEEGEYTVRITNLLGNWLGSDDFGLIGDAVAEVVADLGLPEEGHTTFIAYESGERQDVFWTKWFEIATVASVLVEPGAAIGKGERS